MQTSSFAHVRMNSPSITDGSKRGRLLYIGATIINRTGFYYRLSDIKLHIWFDSAHHDLVTLSEVEGEKV